MSTDERLTRLLIEAAARNPDIRIVPTPSREDAKNWIAAGHVALCTKDQGTFLHFSHLERRLLAEVSRHFVYDDVEDGHLRSHPPLYVAHGRYSDEPLDYIVTMWSPRSAEHAEIPLGEGLVHLDLSTP